MINMIKIAKMIRLSRLINDHKQRRPWNPPCGALGILGRSQAWHFETSLENLLQSKKTKIKDFNRRVQLEEIKIESFLFASRLVTIPKSNYKKTWKGYPSLMCWSNESQESFWKTKKAGCGATLHTFVLTEWTLGRILSMYFPLLREYYGKKYEKGDGDDSAKDQPGLDTVQQSASLRLPA